ncbi:hypothetical protein FOFC_18142 [Fusarium oxysporum]|nr:hypothetical protein FOFC_18142 [Fusarium oxysporum]
MEDSILSRFMKSYESLDQHGGRDVGGWRGVLCRLQRKISTPTSERNYKDFVPRASDSREDSEAPHCIRRRITLQPCTAASWRVVRPYCLRCQGYKMVKAAAEEGWSSSRH